MKEKVIKNLLFNKKAVVENVGGGSGLFSNDLVYLVSDGSNVLYVYDQSNFSLQKKVSLKASGELEENLEKKDKPDFEACASLKGRHYIFGSGSAENRFEMVILDKEFNFLERVSIKRLYSKMMESGDVKKDNFNIEGVILTDDAALFFNRGNGPDGKNGIFTVRNWLKDDFELIGFTSIELPDIDGYPSGFSDAILHNGYICFLATAEKTDSVYDDGEIVGSAFGVMDTRTFEILDFEILTRDFKLEGMTVTHHEYQTKFLICDDSDDAENNSTHFFTMEIDWEFNIADFNNYDKFCSYIEEIHREEVVRNYDYEFVHSFHERIDRLIFIFEHWNELDERNKEFAFNRAVLDAFSHGYYINKDFLEALIKVADDQRIEQKLNEMLEDSLFSYDLLKAMVRHQIKMESWLNKIKELIDTKCFTRVDFTEEVFNDEMDDFYLEMETLLKQL